MFFGFRNVTSSVLAGSVERLFVGGQLSVGSLTQVAFATRLKNVIKPTLLAGRTPFVSFKPKPTEVLAGAWDRYFESAAQVLPNGTFVTVWHEPENDMPGETYIGVYLRAYARLKLINPRLRVGPVNMAYQWEPHRTSTATPSVWATDKKDFHGVDIYSSLSTHPTYSIPQKSSWPRWSAMAGDPKLWIVVERGIHQTVSQSAVLDKDISYLTSVEAMGLMYWNSGGAPDGSTYLLGQPALDLWNLKAK